MAHLPPGDIHENREARHVVTLAADVCVVSENHLAALRRPAAVAGTDTKHKHEYDAAPPRPPTRRQVHSQYGVVPEDADGFGALLGGDQAKLHGDGFVQRVLQQLVVVVHCDAHHWRVNDGALWDTEAKGNTVMNKEI